VRINLACSKYLVNITINTIIQQCTSLPRTKFPTILIVLHPVSHERLWWAPWRWNVSYLSLCTHSTFSK
jgi:hypothetical protein